MSRSYRAVRRIYCGAWCSRCNPSIRHAQCERVAIAEARCDANEAQIRVDEEATTETIQCRTTKGDDET